VPAVSGWSIFAERGNVLAMARTWKAASGASPSTRIASSEARVPAIFPSNCPRRSHSRSQS